MTPTSAVGRLHQMVERGQLVRLQGPNRESAQVLFDDFTAHHRGVGAVLGVGDYAGTLLLAYEASRKVAQALLLVNGFRVPNVEGAHRHTFDAAQWLVTGKARQAVDDAKYLRLERNDNMYRESRVGKADAEEAHAVVDELAKHVGPELVRLLS